MTEVTVHAIQELVGGRLVGDGTRRIRGIGDLRSATADRIGFVRHARYHEAAAQTNAGALLSAVELATRASLIVVADVDLAYAKVAMLFHPTPRASEHRVHPTAVVAEGAELMAPVEIGPRAVVGRSRIGKGSVIMAGAFVGDDVVIGENTVVYPNATIYPNVQIGSRVLVHSNSVVGSDGFGYAREGAVWIKVPQLGSVIVEDDVEIGAGSAIDRGTLGVTRIGARTKFDNLCHVAHNCTIGSDVVMAAGAMVAGSTKLGDRCVLAGQVGIAGHLDITSDVRLGGGTIVLKDIKKPCDYMGHPVLEKRRFLRLLRVLRGMVGRGDE
jgi:UDP-3-O-[3-hydroxymyristoyl] glucosamine N-acyltransferase